MTNIEGITPHEKHQTVEERRGKFEPHHEIRARSLSQRQFLGLIAILSLILLFAGWVVLAKNGLVFKSTSSDENFVGDITNSFSSNRSVTQTNTSTNSSTNVTAEEKKVLNDVDKELFPEFQQ